MLVTIFRVAKFKIEILKAKNYHERSQKLKDLKRMYKINLVQYHINTIFYLIIFFSDLENSKGQCTISKILFPFLLYTFIEQNIFFSRDMFLPTPFLSKNSWPDERKWLTLLSGCFENRF